MFLVLIEWFDPDLVCFDSVSILCIIICRPFHDTSCLTFRSYFLD